MHIAFGMCSVRAEHGWPWQGANIVRFSQENHHFYRLRSSSTNCPCTNTHTLIPCRVKFFERFLRSFLFQFQMDIIFTSSAPTLSIACCCTKAHNFAISYALACNRSWRTRPLCPFFYLFIFIVFLTKLIIISICAAATAAICFRCIKYNSSFLALRFIPATTMHREQTLPFFPHFIAKQ